VNHFIDVLQLAETSARRRHDGNQGCVRVNILKQSVLGIRVTEVKTDCGVKVLAGPKLVDLGDYL
jgi:hypothetical protein